MADSVQEREVRPTMSFKDALLQATFSQGRVLDNHIREIELGIFGDEARSLVQATLEDPRKSEFGKLVYVTNDRRVLLQNKATKGDWEEVKLAAEIATRENSLLFPRNLRQNRFIGAAVHSHPFDDMPSFEDLSSILKEDDEVMAETAVFVATPKRIMLVFRGEKTRHLSSDEIGKKLDEASRLVSQSLLDYINAGAHSIEDIAGFHTLASAEVSRTTIDACNLRLFEGPLDGSKVVLNKREPEKEKAPMMPPGGGMGDY